MMNKTECINNLIQHIENNPADDLDVRLLSNVGYVSYAQLYRDFYSLTGHSVKEYVRKRRLSNALALIKTSDLSLTNIALQCGYSSHQALCRAVRQSLGLTPSGYRNSDTYYFFPPFNGKHFCGRPSQSVLISSENIPETARILFYHSDIEDIENIAVSTFLKVFPQYNGQIFGRNGEETDNKFCYELYLTDTDADYSHLKSHGFEITDRLPCLNAVFAVLTVKNDNTQINDAWNYLYSEWLQNSMFEYTDEPHYEEYILKNGKPAKLKLYLPIKKRSEETKITLIRNPKLHFIVSKANGDNAEKTASQTVLAYLTENYPHILQVSKKFYLKKESDSYICGVQIKSQMRIDSENIEYITADQNDYLVLESNVMGDYTRYFGMLLSFAQNNGMTAEKSGIFAVYSTKESFDNPKIKMYCPVKIDTK